MRSHNRLNRVINKKLILHTAIMMLLLTLILAQKIRRRVALDPKHLFLTINSKCLFLLINIIEIGLKYTFPGKRVVLTLY